MPNLDFPGVCLACADEKCRVTPGDLDTARERVHELPEGGLTRTIIGNMIEYFPKKFSSDEEAYLVFDAMKAVIANGLKIHDLVDFEGIGNFRTRKENGHHTVTLDADPKLLDHEHDMITSMDHAKEHVKSVKGHTRTLLKIMKDTFPKQMRTLADAYMVYFPIRATLANNLRQGQETRIEGIGTFRVEGDKVQFTPERVLEDVVNE